MARRSIFAVCVLLWLIPAQAHAQLAFVSRTQDGTSSPGVSIVSTAHNHAHGNLLVALISRGYPSTAVVTDTALDTWSQCGGDFDGGTVNTQSIFYTITNGNAANVVTATLSDTSQYRFMVVYEISGADSSPCGDTDSGSSIGTAISTDNPLTVTASEEIICMLVDAFPTISNATYNVTNFGLTGDPTLYFADGYHIVSSSEAATATQTTSSGFIIVAASFKVAGSGAHHHGLLLGVD